MRVKVGDIELLTVRDPLERTTHILATGVTSRCDGERPRATR